MLQSIGVGLPPYLKQIRDHFEESAKASLGTDSFATTTADGCSMSPSQEIALARQELRFVH